MASTPPELTNEHTRNEHYFKKAFDLVPHSKRIEKLQSINLPAYIVNWVAAYLCNRKQFVSIGSYFSNELSVMSGVPQLSVLGPLLFLIYINDIVNEICPPIQIRLFADDCICLTKFVPLMINWCLIPTSKTSCHGAGDGA